MEGSGERSSLPRCRLTRKKAKQKFFVFALLDGRLARNGDSRGSVGLGFRATSRFLAMVWTDFGACRRIGRIEEGSERKLVILV